MSFTQTNISYFLQLVVLYKTFRSKSSCTVNFSLDSTIVLVLKAQVISFFNVVVKTYLL